MSTMVYNTPIMGCETPELKMLKELGAINGHMLKDSDESRRKKRLDILCKDKDKAIGQIEKYSYLYGRLESKEDRNGNIVFSYNTNILVSAEGLEEEGTTKIVLSKEEKGCRVRVYTKATPGNGGLSSINLQPLKELQ